MFKLLRLKHIFRSIFLDWSKTLKAIFSILVKLGVALNSPDSAPSLCIDSGHSRTRSEHRWRRPRPRWRPRRRPTSSEGNSWPLAAVLAVPNQKPRYLIRCISFSFLRSFHSDTDRIRIQEFIIQNKPSPP